MDVEKKHKLYHLKYGFVGYFTEATINEIMDELGGVFKLDNPFTICDML